MTVAECVATDSSPDTWLLPSRIRPTSWTNVVNQFEIIGISRLGLLSFGPAIAGSLLESIFIDSSLDPAIVGSVLLSMCIACIYTIIYVYITLSKTRYTYGRRNHHAPTFSVSLVFNVVLKGSFTKVSSYEVLKFDYNRVAQRIMEWRIVAKRIEGSRIVRVASRIVLDVSFEIGNRMAAHHMAKHCMT